MQAGRSNADRRIPATVLTGFLGSGKTTLLNYILTATHGQRIAVIENEFGEISIDADLVLTSDEQIFEMSNGCCLCCTARTDLIELLHKLIDRGAQLDRIVLETSGLADPNPVAQTFFVDDNVATGIALDAIVTLVDAKHIERHLDEAAGDGPTNMVVEQVAFADRLILNKIDLVDEAELTRVEKRLRGINTTAQIARSSYAQVALDKVLGVGAFDLSATMAIDPGWLDVDEHWHDPDLESVSIRFSAELHGDRLDAWLDDFLGENGDQIYRLKGVIALKNEHRRCILQSVHRIVDRRFADPWGREPRVSKLVVIGRDLDRAVIEQGLASCVT